MKPTNPLRPLLGSLTRIADLESMPLDALPLPNQDWDTGDYVLGEIISAGNASARIELPCGREMCPVAGDTVIGVLGKRAATLEAVGDWRDIREDGIMDVMTAAGLIGRITSKSPFVGEGIRLHYGGHIVREKRKVTMRDFAPPLATKVDYRIPTLLIIGTSMSSGKTISGRMLVRSLTRMGLRVVGAKLTGAGRLRDVLALRDAGAVQVFDFVDGGLPSTVCPKETFEESLEIVLGRINDVRPDVVVAEAGASPLEPYNGNVAMDRIRSHVCFTLLCASDPYAVVGVTQGFGMQPDLVSGVAASTTAGCRVVEKLSGVKALNLQDPSCAEELVTMLKKRIGL